MSAHNGGNGNRKEWTKPYGDFPWPVFSSAPGSSRPGGRKESLISVQSDPSTHPIAHPMAWTTADDTPSRRVFTRPLNPLELGFFYDSKLNGVADLVENYLVVTSKESLFHPENVSRAWITIKQIFPLLGATTKKLESPVSNVLLVVSELDLGVARPNDTTFGVAHSEEAIHLFVDQLVSGPRKLSDELLARLYIYSRADKPGHFHALFHHSHYIIDEISALAMIRTFFDVLSLPPPSAVPDLQTRLALCVGVHSLNPKKHLSSAQTRWRQATGQIIRKNRRQKLRVGLGFGASGQLTHNVRRGVRRFHGRLQRTQNSRRLFPVGQQ